MSDASARRVDRLLAVARTKLGMYEARTVMSTAWLAKLLDVDRAWLLAHPEHEVSLAKAQAFADGVDAMALGKPLAYLLGTQAFYGRPFVVSRAVLIPRPETELLIETALAMFPPDSDGLFADVGTGSGCIALTLAAERPRAHVVASDISAAALAVARANAEALGVVERVTLAEGDLFAGADGPFDLVCSNPPYVESADVAALPFSRHEPYLALDGGDDGLAVVARLLPATRDRLKPGGRMLMEMGYDQGDRVPALARTVFPAAAITVKQDLAGHDRLLVIET